MGNSVIGKNMFQTTYSNASYKGKFFLRYVYNELKGKWMSAQKKVV